jgi:rare lipoprotein A
MCIWSIAVLAAPVPIEVIARKIQGPTNISGLYSRSPATEVQVEFGIASWYDCPTRNEEIHKPHLALKDRIYPVAHKTLPFGTLVKVINPRNGKKILTRVIDRGPFIAGRIIDLNREGAKALDISGIGKIILKIYKVNPKLLNPPRIK